MGPPTPVSLSHASVKNIMFFVNVSFYQGRGRLYQDQRASETGHHLHAPKWGLEMARLMASANFMAKPLNFLGGVTYLVGKNTVQTFISG